MSCGGYDKIEVSGKTRRRIKEILQEKSMAEHHESILVKVGNDEWIKLSSFEAVFSKNDLLSESYVTTIVLKGGYSINSGWSAKQVMIAIMQASTGESNDKN